MKPFFTLVFSFTMMLMLHSMAAGQTPLSGAETLNPSPVRRVYSHLLEPREHPDYDRRYVHPPSWETFGNRTQFAALRGFGVEDGRIVGFVEALERYTETHKLGTVIWPSYPIIFAENLNELAEEIKRRGLFLFDIWGYVPGSGPAAIGSSTRRLRGCSHCWNPRSGNTGWAWISENRTGVISAGTRPKCCRYRITVLSST